MDFLERWSQYQAVRGVLELEERVATGPPEFRWYEELHGALMLNCIGNGHGAVSLMALGSYVNHRPGRTPTLTPTLTLIITQVWRLPWRSEPGVWQEGTGSGSWPGGAP